MEFLNDKLSKWIDRWHQTLEKLGRIFLFNIEIADLIKFNSVLFMRDNREELEKFLNILDSSEFWLAMFNQTVCFKLLELLKLQVDNLVFDLLR